MATRIAFFGLLLLTTVAAGINAPSKRLPVIPPRASATPLSGVLNGTSASSGAAVSLSRLAKLPAQTASNTLKPSDLKQRIRRYAANGSYISITATGCNTFGDQFPVGCVLTWQSEQLSSGHQQQDYQILSTNGNGAAATPINAPYSGSSGLSHQTTLSSPGTYIFGTYDNFTSQWIAVIYVNAGQIANIGVYEDAYHTQPSYQFQAANGQYAYIYLQNVSQSDYFVVGVEQTADSPNCVFIGPPPTPAPYVYPAHQLCNLTASGGEQAPNGNLSVAWPLNASLLAGTYSVEVYDLTQGYRVGQVQVTLDGSYGTVINLFADASGPQADPSPNPSPSGSMPTSIIAWEGYYQGGSDQSTTGVKAVVNGIPGSPSYIWTLVDPQGQVMATPAATVVSNNASYTFILSNIFNPAPYALNPGMYPFRTFAVQLYDKTHDQVIAAQSFQIVGYSSETQFSNGSSLSATLPIMPGSNTVTGLKITNTSNAIYNGNGDNLAAFTFSSGPDYALSSTTGYGIMLSTSSGAVAPCATACTVTTAVDTGGNIWNVQAKCSIGGLSTRGECNIAFTPTSSSVTLAPGASIILSNVTFFYAASGQCGSSCAAPTSELPQHGLQWSNYLPSYTPVYFTNAASSQSATAAFRIIGSDNRGTRNIVAQAPPTFSVPFVGNHFYRSWSGQADYAMLSPYTAPFNTALNNSNADVFAFTLKNSGANSINEVAIALPPLFTSQGFTFVDSLSTASWSTATCPSSISKVGLTQWVCFIPSSGIAPGATATLYIDQTMPDQSFTYSEIQIEAEANSTWFTVSTAPGTTSTPDGLYSIDNLALAAYSLNGNDMTAYFSPATAGVGATANLGLVVQNTSNTVDANPDSIDAVVIEAPSTSIALSSTPAIANPGWTYLGSLKLNSGTTTQYWFGLCPAQYTAGAQQGAAYGGPPSASSSPFLTPLSAAYVGLGTCSNEADALSQGQKLSISNLQFSNVGSSGTQTWKMYAHGANVGGWSAAQPFSLVVTAESASIGFTKVNGNPTMSGVVYSIGGSPNTYQYAITNTSGTSDISKIDVTLPGEDVSGANAYDGTTTPGYWFINGITSGGVTLSAPSGQVTGVDGCSVSSNGANTYNATSAGANGQIEISGCVNFKPGDTIYVNFSADSPQIENDTYAFPATVDGSAAGPASLGADEISVAFTLGLNVVVNPVNPGPGGSTPVENCGNPCSFVGQTIQFGNINNNTSFAFVDVVRASVTYTGATNAGQTMTLYAAADNNPINSTGSPSNELLIEVDAQNSTNGAGVVFSNQASYAPIPTVGQGLQLATVPQTTRSGGYDIINNFKVAIGAENTSPETSNITYTLVVN